MLVPIDEVPSDCVLLDVSEGSDEHIPGSIAIPYSSFLNDSELKSPEEISKILGDAGISNEDCIIVYGECLPCGKGINPALFVYYVMKTIGHEKIRVLDGNMNDWKAAGKPVSAENEILPPKTYTPKPTQDFTATYDYVRNEKPQIVDARPIQDFGRESIPDAINRPYESMFNDGKIKNEAQLERIFASLDIDGPVVVYGQTLVTGSMAWFAAKLAGYDTKLYSYEDWVDHKGSSTA